MKNIWFITKTNIKRNPIAILIAVLSAIALCLIMYFLGKVSTDSEIGKISVGILDYDKSTLSEDFKVYLSERLEYKLLENYTYEELSTELIDKNISVIIEIPENFQASYIKEEPLKLIVTSLDDYENAAFTELYMNNYLSSIELLAGGAKGDEQNFIKLLEDYDKDAITLTQTSAEIIDKETLMGETGFINSIGFYLMIIFASSVILSYMVLDDRLMGVFNRIQAAPVKPIHYILGTGVFGMLNCLLQIGLYIGYIYIRDIKIGVPIWTVLLFMIIFAVFTVSFSLLIAMAVKSKNAITSIIIGFSTIGCILGGAYFPIDMSPKTLQNLARIFPQFWFMEAFRGLQLDLSTNILPNISILTLFAVLSILLGAVLFAQNYRSSK